MLVSYNLDWFIHISVHDTKLGANWRVVEKFQQRQIWDVPEVDVPQPDDVFQQDESTNVIPTEPIDDDVVLRRDDIDVVIIPMEVLQFDNHVQPLLGMDDDFKCDDEDELTIEGDDEEEDELDSDFDSDMDIVC